ncbi:hypothetical protein Bca101_089679 [Brassica carinata]
MLTKLKLRTDKTYLSPFNFPNTRQRKKKKQQKGKNESKKCPFAAAKSSPET